MNAQSRLKSAALVTCLLAVIATAGAAGAAQSPEPAALQLTALMGADGATLEIEAPAGVTAFEFVHVEVHAPGDPEDEPSQTVNLKDVATRDGVATIPLAEAHRGDSVDVAVHIRESSPPRTAIHRGETVVRLRPDLAVAAVYAPPQTLTTRAIDVVADLSELDGETGATATVKLMLGPTPIAEEQTVIVPAGQTLSVTFHDVKLTSAMKADPTVEITGATPFELDTTNNTGTTTVEVTEHELPTPTNVLFPSLAGYGAQFNNHLYAPITQSWMTPDKLRRRGGEGQGPPAAARPDLLQRQLGGERGQHASREWPENYASFVEGRAARPRDRGHDRHLVPEPQQHRHDHPSLGVRRVRDGEVRRRARGPDRATTT